MFAHYGSRLAGIRKIAVLRANAVGDFIFALPALEALARTYPEAEITLLGKPWHEAFLRGRPGPVHRVIVLPGLAGVGEPEDFPTDAMAQQEILARLRSEQFDLAVQLHGGGKYSNPFIKSLGARCTVGLQADGAPPLDRTLPYIYFHNEVLRLLEVVSLVGAKAGVIEPRLVVTEQDRDELEANGGALPGPVVVIQPGASDPRRCWPAEKFAQVADALYEAGATIAVNGTAAEQPIVSAVMAAMAHPAVDLAGRLSLGGLSALLQQAQVVISNDTGPLHLAAAVGAATVGIFWIGNLFNSGPIAGARHRHATSMRMDCPICGQNCWHVHCGHAASFVADIPVDAVLPQALSLYALESPSLGNMTAVANLRG